MSEPPVVELGWNPLRHPRIPRGHHGGGEFVSATGAARDVAKAAKATRRVGKGDHEIAATHLGPADLGHDHAETALTGWLDATRPREGEGIAVTRHKGRMTALKVGVAAAALAAGGNMVGAGIAHSPTIQPGRGPSREQLAAATGREDKLIRYQLPPQMQAALALSRAKLTVALRRLPADWSKMTAAARKAFVASVLAPLYRTRELAARLRRACDIELARRAAHTRTLELAAEIAAQIGLSWDPARHPRIPKGLPGGGRFVSAEPDLIGTMRREGGFTYDPVRHKLLRPGIGVKGFAIAEPHTEHLLGSGDITREQFSAAVADLMKANRAHFAHGGKLGGWYDPDRDTFMVELSNIHDVPRDQAIKLGQSRNQVAILDMGSGEFIPTGGTGE